MFEIQYGKEPFDMKLFLIQVIRGIKYLILGSLLGGLVIGGIYYLVNVTFDFTKEYCVTSQYYVEYVQDPYLESAYIYYNEDTWNLFITTEAFLDDMLLTDTAYEKEEIMDAIYVSILSDVRALTVSVTTDDPTQTEELAQDLVLAFTAFAQEQDVIGEIRLLDISGSAELVKADVRPFRAVILGIFVGFLVSLTVFVICYFLYDVVIVPVSLRKRYRIPVLGCDTSEELQENLAYACRELEKIAIVPIGTQLDVQDVASKLGTSDCKAIAFPSMELAPEAVRALREVGSTVLVVKAGSDTMASIDRALSFYGQQEVEILGFILWEADELFYEKLRK